MCALAALPGAGAEALSGQSRESIVAALDSIARAHVASEILPGVSIAVVRGDDVLLQRGYGLVDVEWGVQTPRDAHASYEIGSVTKQFTAAALLLLAEEDRVDLDADVTEYVDFDSGGRAISLRRLFDHTSGIRSYTEVPVFGGLSVQDLPRDTLVRLVEKEPFDFEPGAALIYNNSAYFLLGLIIETVTGESYAEVVRERLFEPAGMDDSYYCSEVGVRTGRAHGYTAVSADQIIRAPYLNHKWPYAAGSLCSTVGDLVRWNAALHGGRILSAASYEMMTTPRPLEDGTSIRYAMGLDVGERRGRRLIAHGGGINGFLSQLSWYPDDELTVVVLQNSTGPAGAGGLADALAGAVLGPPRAVEANRYAGALADLAGTYRGAARGQPLTVRVSESDGTLEVAVGEGGNSQTMTPTYREGLRWVEGDTWLTFISDSGRITGVRYDDFSAHYVLQRVGTP